MGKYYNRGEKKFYWVWVDVFYDWREGWELYDYFVNRPLLVYAANIQEARRVGWRELSRAKAEWIEVRAKWVREPDPVWRFALRGDGSQEVELPYCAYCSQLAPPSERGRCQCGEQMSREALALYERAAQAESIRRGMAQAGAGDVKPVSELWEGISAE